MDLVLAGRKHEIPLPPSAGRHTSLDGVGSMREFQNYIARYDAAFSFSYRHFADALKEIDPRLVYTTGSFGSSPGALARGGYPIGSMPGREMHAGLDVQMTYDWSEEGSSKPLHNVALIDRLRSYFPEKETWANLDDFGIILGREARQRAYAIALTRGVKAVGSNCLSLPGGTGYVNDFKGTYGMEPLDNQRELFAWIHTFGGPYAMMEPEASIGVLYVHEQAVCRHTGAPDPEGPHEGKTTEALFLCHAAGWPAKIVTPEELKRGLPPTMKALLLTGLNKFEGDWQWSEGLEDALAAFVKGGGRMVLDHESVCPVTAAKTDMKICAYAPQSHVDFSPLLLERNQENARKLNVALEGVPKPAVTGSDTAWAIPSRAGDVRYVTVVNWLPRRLPDDKDGKPCYANASRKDGVGPQIARLAWRVTGPIYDLRAGKAVSIDQASSCDLTRDAFRLYALPPKEPTAPAVSFLDRTDGWACASVDVAGMKGVPVQLTLERDGDQATVFSASGMSIQLPIRAGDKPGIVKVLTTELLSGKASESALEIKAARPPAPRGPVSLGDAAAIRTFMTRNVPLAIALTPAQKADPDMARLAIRLQEIAARRGRAAVLKEISTNAFIVSLQELKPSMYVGPGFPQWRTEPDDVILLGTPKENPLLYDELRGGLLPSDALALEQGRASLGYAWSPFVFGRHAVNLIAPDQAGLAAAVDALARLWEIR